MGGGGGGGGKDDVIVLGLCRGGRRWLQLHSILHSCSIETTEAAILDLVQMKSSEAEHEEGASGPKGPFQTRYTPHVHDAAFTPSVHDE